MHWKLTLSYDGTNFHGWQVQPALPSVQGALRQAIAQVCGETVLPQGSGRTDAGVHALGQIATFTLNVPIPAENLLHALNRALPSSIRVLAAEAVPASFHARHSAVRKSYEYRIWDRGDGERGDGLGICPPFLAPYVWDCQWPLAFDAMRQAAAALLGTHDFTSFAASDPDLAQRSGEEPVAPLSPVRTLFASSCLHEGGLLLYRVTGSGFLHHMVRNIVGTLVEIGRGALSPDAISTILAARNRSAAGPTAPPQGLYLVNVEYEGGLP